MPPNIELTILGLSYSHTQSDSYAVVLGEKDGKRKIPVIIGQFEAQAIAIEMEKMKPPRPLTHDLFVMLAKSFEINLNKVIINKFLEGIFYAQLICQCNDDEYEIDARLSDAVALALRFDCPIYTNELVLTQTAITGPDDTETETETQSVKKTEKNDVDLEIELQQAIENEDYERASIIRDTLKSMKNEQD